MMYSGVESTHEPIKQEIPALFTIMSKLISLAVHHPIGSASEFPLNHVGPTHKAGPKWRSPLRVLVYTLQSSEMSEIFPNTRTNYELIMSM